MIQWGTVISEFVLASFSLLFSTMAYSKSLKICILFLIIAISAISGIARFGMDQPSMSVYRLHRSLSNISFIFIPTFFASSYVYPINKIAYLVFIFIPIVLTCFTPNLDPNVIENTMSLFALLSLFCIIYASYIGTIIMGLVGVVLLILAVIFLQSGPTYGFMKGVDMFHYLLIPATYCLANGVILI